MLSIHTRFVLCSLFLGLSTLTTAHAQHPDDIHWDTRFGLPGVDGEIRCMAVDGDWVYVGGQFSLMVRCPLECNRHRFSF